ncbi:hypothetical protein RV06_GL001929 [Enterococcus haemoperoxidus]|nr:hypothetical protein RV06_GL001929 [Enterococcus haemoperoxidus]
MKHGFVYLVLLVYSIISYGEEGNVATLRDFSYKVNFPKNHRRKS